MDAANSVRLFASDCFPKITLKHGKNGVTVKKARQTALQDLGEGVVRRGMINRGTTIYPTIDGHVKAFHLEIPAEEPLGDWNYFIDCQTGEVIDSFNAMRFAWPTPQWPAARARVYPENPDESALITGMLRNQKSLKHLDGFNCRVFNDDGPEALAGPNYRFDFPPDSTHFDESQVYYQVEKVYGYFRQLGFRGFTFNNAWGKTHNGQMAANVHVGVNFNNAYYSPWSGQIYFGDGSYPPTGYRDFAKEADVVFHEFTHAVIDEYRPGIAGTDGGALHEGYSDYFACSLMDDYDLGEYVVPGPEKKGIIRTLDNNLQYPGSPASPHERGKRWGGACWDLRKEVGQEVADWLLFGSVLLMSTTTPTFKYAKDRLLLIDSVLCGGEYKNVIKRIYEKERGIPV